MALTVASEVVSRTLALERLESLIRNSFPKWSAPSHLVGLLPDNATSRCVYAPLHHGFPVAVPVVLFRSGDTVRFIADSQVEELQEKVRHSVLHTPFEHLMQTAILHRTYNPYPHDSEAEKLALSALQEDFEFLPFSRYAGPKRNSLWLGKNDVKVSYTNLNTTNLICQLVIAFRSAKQDASVQGISVLYGKPLLNWLPGMAISNRTCFEVLMNLIDRAPLIPEFAPLCLTPSGAYDNNGPYGSAKD